MRRPPSIPANEGCTHIETVWAHKLYARQMPPSHLQILGDAWKQDQITDMAFYLKMEGSLEGSANDSSTLQIKHHQTNQFFCHLFLSTFGLSSMRNKPVLILRLWELVIKLTSSPPPSAGGLCGVYTPCSFFRFALNDLTVEGTKHKVIF